MATKELVAKLDERIGFLDAYKQQLKTEPGDGVDPTKKAALREEEIVTDARLDELKKLKKIIYTS